MDLEWIKIWEQLDQDDLGIVSLRDLENCILNTSLTDNLPPEALTELLIQADQNRDSSISKEEFLLLVHNIRRLPRMQRVVRDAAFLTIPRSKRTVEVRRYLDEFSCKPPPIFMPLISVAELCVAIYYSTLPNTGDYSSQPNNLHLFTSPIIYNPSRRYEAWRFLSYMFLHSGWVHLVNNLIIQLLLGIVLELVHKWWRMMLVYMIGVIGGSLGTSVTNPSIFLIGASGGGYAIAYSHLANLIMNWSEMRLAWIQLLIICFLSVWDVSYGVYDIYFSDNPSNISHMAHMGGAVAGILVGVNVFRNLKQRTWEKYCWWTSLVFLLTLIMTAIIIHCVLPDYFPPTDWTPLHG